MKSVATTFFSVCWFYVGGCTAADGINRKHLFAFPECGKQPKPIQRIINGEKADMPIPWYVYLAIPTTAKGNYGASYTCSGALITDRIGLTAAHCFCGKLIPCTTWERGEKKQVRGPPSTWGEVGATKRGFGRRFHVSAVVIHEHYVLDVNNRRDPDDFDIAIFELSESTSTVPNVRPICLPGNKWSSKQLNSREISVSTAGYGVTRSPVPRWGAEAFKSRCQTNKFGPVRYQSCETPCNKTHAYPNFEWCNVAYEASKASYAYDGITIQMREPKMKIFCPRPTDGDHRIGRFGWCYTARDCSEEGSNRWGFCSQACDLNESQLSQYLYFVTLHTVPNCTERFYYSKPDIFNKTTEFCVAGVAKKPTIGEYSLNGPANMSSSYHFARVIPGGGMEKLGYYDSCEGDSGGSMWVHDDFMRAVTVGIISRGFSTCGLFNLPAFSTTVNEYLVWIEKHLGVDFTGVIMDDIVEQRNSSPSPKGLKAMVPALLLVTTQILRTW